jgi:hypothetical protein
MNEPTTSSISPKSNSMPAAHPDWDHFTEELHCPLCGYSLRGLSEPRCPECGYSFTWPELIEASRTQHPFLFEHSNNIWNSFWKTFLAGWLPARFWKSISPAHVLKPRRLIFYWVIIQIISLSGMTVTLVDDVIKDARVYEANRVRFRTLLASGRVNIPNPPWPEGATLDEQLDSLIPRTYSVKWFLTAGDPEHRITLWLFLFFHFTWMPITLLVLMIFRWSMRRAKVRPAHVLRCVVYSGDLILLWGLSLLLIGFAELVQLGLDGPLAWGFIISPYWLLLIPLAMFGLSWRLWRAYCQYLQFPHAAATVVATQVIVFGMMLVLLQTIGQIIDSVS